MHQKKKNPSYACRAGGAGFSLMEILVVLAIMGIMATLGLTSFENFQSKAKNAEAIQAIGFIQKGIYGYEFEFGEWPDSLDQAGKGDILDPWGSPYVYMKIEGAEKKDDWRKDKHLKPINSDFDLYSMGADGESKKSITDKISLDDIIRANGGAFIGLAAVY